MSSASARGGRPRDAVVVTGASSGIGAAVAERLSRSAWRVFGTVRNEEDGRELERSGATAVLMDVTDERSILAGRDTILGALDGARLAGLVNNAGIGVVGPIECLELDEIRRVFDVNVFGALAATKAFLPRLRRDAGRVVMISSISGRVAAPFLGGYAGSKFALEALSDSLRREIRPHGVDVVVIQPGPVSTPIWEKLRRTTMGRFAGSGYEEALSRFGREVERSERRALPAAEVARAVQRSLTARRPRARIVVARYPALLRVFAMLPDRWIDRLTAGRLGK